MLRDYIHPVPLVRSSVVCIWMNDTMGRRFIKRDFSEKNKLNEVNGDRRRILEMSWLCVVYGYKWLYAHQQQIISRSTAA